MKYAFLILLCLNSINISAQTSSPSKKETADYLVSKILAYGDNIKNVLFDEEKCILTIEYASQQPNPDDSYKKASSTLNWPCSKSHSIISQNISSLNANSIAWELQGNTLLMQIGARNGFYGDKRTSICEESPISGLEPSIQDRGFTRVLFGTSKVADDPKFQDKIKNAYARLIALCGGVPLQDDPFDR